MLLVVAVYRLYFFGKPIVPHSARRCKEKTHRQQTDKTLEKIDKMHKNAKKDYEKASLLMRRE